MSTLRNSKLFATLGSMVELFGSAAASAAAVEAGRAGDVEAAANFFQALHRLDQAQLDLILAMPFPDEGLPIPMLWKEYAKGQGWHIQ